jgi:hypothetical protein
LVKRLLGSLILLHSKEKKKTHGGLNCTRENKPLIHDGGDKGGYDTRAKRKID